MLLRVEEPVVQVGSPGGGALRVRGIDQPPRALLWLTVQG